MTRRTSFLKISMALVAVAVADTITSCKEVFGAVSRYSWPGYPSKSALYKHLLYSSNHREIKKHHIKGKSLQSLCSIHDRSHSRKGGSPRWKYRRRVGSNDSGQTEDYGNVA